MAVTAAPFAVPVFAACGADGWGAVQDLRACEAVSLVTSPRHASVLLVAGSIPTVHGEALDRVHDQVPHPRASLAWPCGGTSPPGPWAVTDTDMAGIIEAIVAAHHRVTSDPARSEPDRLADTDPNEWRGVGPFGQGGEGMMGGVPYGRPMAMTGPDRDGLALDQLHLRLGPFLDALPAGLVLDVTLQGDVLQECEVVWAPDQAATAVAGAGREHGPVDELRHLAWALHLAGLDALATRAARLAVGERDGTDRAVQGAGYGRLRRAIRRSGWLWTLRGVGPVDGLDAAQRWRHRLDQLDHGLARTDPYREGGTGTDPPGPGAADNARPTVGRCGPEALGSVVTGLTVTDALTTIASLELSPAVDPDMAAVDR